MWKKTDIHFDPIDSKIVTRDFIISEGKSSAFTFLDKGKNPFRRNLNIPIMYIFKVHRNHPMRIFSAGVNQINIYPANEDKKRYPRMPAEVYKDKMDYDLSTLMLVPFENPYISEPPWKKVEIKKAFVPEKERSTKDISLIYLDHGISIHSQDSLKISEVMPSQVINHIFHWLKDTKEITSRDEFPRDGIFRTKLEGRISIPIEEAKNLTRELSFILEKRYNTRLTFEDYRRKPITP